MCSEGVQRLQYSTENITRFVSPALIAFVPLTTVCCFDSSHSTIQAVQQSGLRFLFRNKKLITWLDMAKNSANVRIELCQMETINCIE